MALQGRSPTTTTSRWRLARAQARPTNLYAASILSSAVVNGGTDGAHSVLFVWHVLNDRHVRLFAVTHTHTGVTARSRAKLMTAAVHAQLDVVGPQIPESDGPRGVVASTQPHRAVYLRDGLQGARDGRHSTVVYT